MVEDNWKHRSKTMTCELCMYYINTRCRRHAPTMVGYPAVFLNDWCGDHKLDKTTIHELQNENNNFTKEQIRQLTKISIN